ncbi:MAG: putative F0F1-ATPase subunit Ca2+/Mg2+ transporter [Bacteriovoracaceae bacterium]|nr:putative F0F1-ATPase subunit Ca2+/Mg2+ transporter [Bacteriovoracaceae bacterium]
MDKKASDRLAMAMGGAQFGVVVAAGLLGGLWIDKKTGTVPLFGILGLIIGFTAGILVIVRIQKELKKDES